ncbi:hypothetical protein D3C85_695880 [compost metagenome]
MLISGVAYRLLCTGFPDRVSTDAITRQALAAKRVIRLEARRVAWVASGRNVGQT